MFIRPTHRAKGVQVRPYGKFVEEWKKVSAKCAEGIYMSLPIEGPEIHGALKEEAIEDIMRVVWFRVGEDMPVDERREAVRANFDELKRHTSELVDRTVAETWARLPASGKWGRRPEVCSPDSMPAPTRVRRLPGTAADILAPFAHKPPQTPRAIRALTRALPSHSCCRR